MIIDPNEKSANKRYPKLKAKAHETALSVFALSKIWKRKMIENDKVHQLPMGLFVPSQLMSNG